MGSNNKLPFNFREVAVASTVVVGFLFGLVAVYLTMPTSDYSFLKLPRSLQELQVHRVLHGLYFHANFHDPRYCIHVLACWFPFWSLQRCSIGGVQCNCRCIFLLFLVKIDREAPFFFLWLDKLQFFQNQVAKRKELLLNYMLFLRLTPTLPNTFINVASPIVDVPFHIFLFATLIGLIPAAYVTVRAGLALGELRSLGDLYDFNSIATLFFIGVVSVTPTLVSKSKS